jgi:hypothetical protein
MKPEKLPIAKRSYLTLQVENTKTQDGFLLKLIKSIPGGKTLHAAELLIDLMQEDYPTDDLNLEYLRDHMEYLIKQNR